MSSAVFSGVFANSHHLGSLWSLLSFHTLFCSLGKEYHSGSLWWLAFHIAITSAVFDHWTAITSAIFAGVLTTAIALAVFDQCFSVVFDHSHHFGSLWWQSFDTAVPSAVFPHSFQDGHHFSSLFWSVCRQPSLRHTDSCPCGTVCARRSFGRLFCSLCRQPALQQFVMTAFRHSHHFSSLRLQSLMTSLQTSLLRVWKLQQSWMTLFPVTVCFTQTLQFGTVSSPHVLPRSVLLSLGARQPPGSKKESGTRFQTKIAATEPPSCYTFIKDPALRSTANHLLSTKSNHLLSKSCQEFGQQLFNTKILGIFGQFFFIKNSRNFCYSANRKFSEFLGKNT